MSRRYFRGPRAAERLRAARRFLADREPDRPFLVVGQRRRAANRLTLEAAASAGVVFGAWRHGFRTLADTLAAARLASAGRVAVTPAARRATVTRVVHEARRAGSLGRFAAVGEGPGLVAQLTRTFEELRLAGLPAVRVARRDPTLARLFEAYGAALVADGFADRAAIYRAAARSIRLGEAPLPVGLPTVFVDVGLANEAARNFGLALAAAAPEVLWTIPEGDRLTEAALFEGGARPLTEEVSAPRAGAADPETALRSAQRHLFEARRPAGGEDRSLTVVGAPGAGAEAIECARFVAEEAAQGCRFDRMAILLHHPPSHAGALAEAFDRAGIPAFFEAGAPTPNAAGRAFLLLLDCALEDLSASRFAEYLSLGETPVRVDREGDHRPEEEARPAPAPSRRWEALILEAEVIGGLDRWERRLSLLGERIRAEAERGGGSAASRAHASRRSRDLERLTATAMPILRALAKLPGSASWGGWARRLGALAKSALVHPDPVMESLGETAPMAGVGGVSLERVRASLGRRLAEVVRRSTGSRGGKVWIGPIGAARGLSFEVVGVPGLAEHAFPRVLREDPMLPDRRRRELSPGLPLRSDRGQAEQLRLRLAVGAAERRLLVTYSNLNLAEGRSQVPSYYLAEVFRAGFGRLPTLEAIQRKAAGAESPVRPGTRAPRKAEAAIDRREYALAHVSDARDAALAEPAAKGAAAWLLADPRLRRALQFAYLRDSRTWTTADGFVARQGSAVLPLLEDFRPRKFTYSATGLESYAECPYRFFLKNLIRLRAVEHPAGMETLDPLTRGSLLHDVFFHLGRRLRELDLMPLPPERVAEAFRVAASLFRDVESEYRERLAPPYRGLWDDQMAGLLGDLRGFVARLAESGVSIDRNEFGFGLPMRDPADPGSVADPVVLPGPLRLRGSIDAVERRADGKSQVTDYKTGRASVRRSPGQYATFGGRVLQPLLYAAAWEAVSKRRVDRGRLFFATVRGGYRETRVDTGSRASRGELRRFVELADRAIAAGRFPAAPAVDGRYLPCDYCDYLPVCGPAPARHPYRKRAGSGRTREVREIRALP